MCQEGKPDTGKLHSSSNGVYVHVALPMIMVHGQWNVCYGSGLCSIIIVTDLWNRRLQWYI